MHLNNATLHHVIVNDIVSRGFVRSASALAEHFAVSGPTLSRALSALMDDHGLVLHPNSDEIWVVHPFSMAPTGFVVRAGERSWWGNCAWCSLGIVELVGATATITTSLGLVGPQVTVAIENGRVLERDFVVHFPVPMTKIWDNVVYSCSMMLLFETEAAVADWCVAHGKTKGDVRPIEQVWEFAREWYGRHLDVAWRKWTAEEAADMFRRHGLDGPIWELPVGDGRF